MQGLKRVLVRFYQEKWIPFYGPLHKQITKYVTQYTHLAAKYYTKHLAKNCNPYILPILAKLTPLYKRYHKLPLFVRKTIRYSMGTLVSGAVIWTVFWESDHKRNPPSVEIVSVRASSLREKATVIGSLAANQFVVLKAQVQGQITEILFKGGQTVTKDQPLIKLDDRVYEAALKEAESQLKTAQANFDRVSKLAVNNAYAPAKAKEEAESKLTQAQSNYEQRKFQMDSTVIKAPFDGIVGLRDEHLSVGAVVDQRQDLVTIVDVDPIRLKFSVPSHLALKMQIGHKAKVQVDSLGTRTFVAEIDAIDSRVNQGTNTLSMQAVADNPHGILKPGLFGRVFIEAGTKENALVVPEVAIDMMGEESFVYRVRAIKVKEESLIDRILVLLKLKKAKIIILALKTPVSIGLRDNENVEIVSGLKEGDLIISTGHMKLNGLDRYPVRAVNGDEYPALMEDITDLTKPRDAGMPSMAEPPAKDEPKEQTSKGQKKKKKKKKRDQDFDDDDDDDDELIEDVPIVPTPKKADAKTSNSTPAAPTHKPTILDQVMAKPEEPAKSDIKSSQELESKPETKTEVGVKPVAPPKEDKPVTTDTKPESKQTVPAKDKEEESVEQKPAEKVSETPAKESQE